MSKFVWAPGVAASRCWVVYKVVSSDRRDGFFVQSAGQLRKSVLTVWDTNPPQLTGLPKYAYNESLYILLKTTSELNGGPLPEVVMDVLVTTMELLE